MFTNEERDELREYYLERNEVFLGPVDNEHANQVIFDLMHSAKKVGTTTLMIASPGGVTDAGFRLAQFMEQELDSRVDARVWGACCSAATYPLLCCQQRLAHPEATFVLHRQTTMIETTYGLDYEREKKEWDKSNKETHKRQVRFYTRKLNLPKEKVEKILLHGTGLDADLSVKKALSLGLITGTMTLAN